MKKRKKPTTALPPLIKGLTWDVFECHGSRYGRWQIQAYDEIEVASLGQWPAEHAAYKKLSAEGADGYIICKLIERAVNALDKEAIAALTQCEGDYAVKQAWRRYYGLPLLTKKDEA